ncbi:hypothetical protein [Mesobacillus foraminis]|nr:hypothetical protein [Mesobacillus foraminis]
MFVAWLITVSLFLICISAKEKDQYDLAILHSQYKNITINNKGIKKLSA